jgi:uncharacterized protein (TIGR02145 family)
MKRLLFLVIIIVTLETNAQNTLVSFAGSGASSSVSIVNVENLTKGTSLLLNGTDQLRLTIPTGVTPAGNDQPAALKIYPNPSRTGSIVQVMPPAEGETSISLYDITGKLKFTVNRYLEKSLQEFHLSGLQTGTYLIIIKGSSYHLAGKLLCNSRESGIIRFEKINGAQVADVKEFPEETKGIQNIVDMEYSSGDLLKLTGTSGNYRTVVMDVPEADKTITFNFVQCADYDGNNYAVVKIGGQTWMAENLKTTHRSDGEPLSSITGNLDWQFSYAQSYCWYSNNESTYKNTYGALYNWYAVNSGYLCPAGWHLPFESEWTVLNDYLAGTNVGNKLKETGIGHWTSGGAGVTNETGFTALPGGFRNSNGSFAGLGTHNYYWSSTEISDAESKSHYLVYDASDMTAASGVKQAGYSVRCIKNEASEYSGKAMYISSESIFSVACLYPISTVNKLTFAAVNPDTFNESAFCGTCISVTGPKGTATFKVSDKIGGCTTCGSGDLDLSSDGYPLIGDLVDGLESVVWHVVPCPITDPVRFYWEDGSNQWYFSLIILDHKNPVSKAEAYIDGSWLNLPRSPYNGFEGTNLGNGPFRLRLTDIFLNVIEEPSITFSPGNIITGTKQF